MHPTLSRIVVALTLLLVLGSSGLLEAQDQPAKKDEIKIDSIRIRRNWRTRESIILRELNISPGETVSRKQIELSISKIWNIGNFAKVNYRIDTLPDQRLVLNVTALDAFTIIPNISFNGNRKEYLFTAGLIDNNFLGRNINLDLGFSTGTNARRLNFNLGIPRQLLYRNMTLCGGFQYGNAQRYRYRNSQCIAGTGYLQKNAWLSIGNPFHTDDHYTFSPDLGISLFSHNSDSSLIPADIPFMGDYSINYLAFSVSESIGLVNRIRHQQDGYLLSAGIGYGFGLNHQSPGYAGVGISGFFARLLNRIVQISAGFNTGHTTARTESLIHYLGPENVKGILSGERWGQSYYSVFSSLHLTYLNHDWMAVEQSFFCNLGNATDRYIELYSKEPLYAAGTKLRLMVPMVPWLGVSVYYAYRGKGKHWYSAEI
jgi:outer membrane protein assembly factor BamA